MDRLMCRGRWLAAYSVCLVVRLWALLCPWMEAFRRERAAVDRALKVRGRRAADKAMNSGGLRRSGKQTAPRTQQSWHETGCTTVWDGWREAAVDEGWAATSAY